MPRALQMVIITSLIVCGIIIGGCIGSTSHPRQGIPTTTPVNTSNLTTEERRTLDIALNNDTIKKDLDDRRYVITAVIVLCNNATSTPAGRGLVAFDLLYPDGTIDYHLVAGVDLTNNSVGSIISEKPLPQNL